MALSVRSSAAFQRSVTGLILMSIPPPCRDGRLGVREETFRSFASAFIRCPNYTVIFCLLFLISFVSIIPRQWPVQLCSWILRAQSDRLCGRRWSEAMHFCPRPFPDAQPTKHFGSSSPNGGSPFLRNGWLFIFKMTLAFIWMTADDCGWLRMTVDDCQWWGPHNGNAEVPRT